MKPNKIINEVYSILEVMQTYGSTVFLGENVTQLQHALQCADLAEIMTNDHEIVIAALFHDIGHLLYQAHNKDSLEIDKNYLGDPSHELTGSQFLQSVGFSERVCAIVANHVNAKRYLLSNDKKYFDSLSEASKESLKFQGGVMTEDEVLVFESNPYYPEILLVRKLDDKAKESDYNYDSIFNYREILIRHLNRQQRKM